MLRAFQLLHERPHVRERVAARFQHILVDEYQEANFAEGMLLRLLIDEHQQLTVVGSDARFLEEVPEARVVKLERNCRSGRRILDAAAAVPPGPAHRRERRARALLARPLGARPGAGRGGRGRAADRRRRAARADRGARAAR